MKYEQKNWEVILKKKSNCKELSAGLMQIKKSVKITHRLALASEKT